jgi:hypothetical protein
MLCGGRTEPFGPTSKANTHHGDTETRPFTTEITEYTEDVPPRASAVLCALCDLCGEVARVSVVSVVVWSGWRESNPRHQLGRLELYH